MISFLLGTSLVMSLVVLFVPQTIVRWVALAGSLVLCFGGVGLLVQFEPTSIHLQLVEQWAWFPAWSVQYFVGIDGLSLWLVLLTLFFVPLVIVGAWDLNQPAFYFHLSVLTLALLGTFVAMDAVLFFVFFELALIPMYFMIGMWGGARRFYATTKFFIFTMAGSIFLLIGLLSLMWMTQDQLGAMSTSFLDFYRLDIPFAPGWSPQTLLFIAFVFAFAVKIPLVFVHTWLPDAHVEAPTPGSVILAGVMLKMGTYGLMRLVLPLMPLAVEKWAWVMWLLSVIGIIYGALVAMVQVDIKKLVAYSSISHMGYVVLGLFAMNIYGLSGGLYQMLNHAVSTGALFFLVGMIYERTHSREIARYGGLAKAMPLFAVAFLIVTLSSIAVPGTNGFVGEFLILMGGFMAHPGIGTLAVLGVILSAIYMLWMYKRVFFGPDGELLTQKGPLPDLTQRELLVLSPLLLLIFWMGIFPNHFLDWSEASLVHLQNNWQNYDLRIGTSGEVP